MNHFDELEKSNQEFHLLLQKVGCGICIYDVEEDNSLTIRYMNDGYCNLCHSTEKRLKAAFINTPLFGVSETDKEKVGAFFRTVIEKKQDGEVSFCGISQTEEAVWVTVKAIYVTENESKDRLYVTYFDNTKEIQTQEQLSSVIHNVPGAVCFYRWKGVKLEPIVVSDKYSELLGTDAKKALEATDGLSFLHVHPGDIEDLQKAVLEALNGSHAINYTYRSFNEKTQSYIWLNMQGKSIPQPDGSQFVYMTYIDITKDKRIEEKLQAKYELEKSRGLFTDKNLLGRALFNLSQDTMIEFEGDKVISDYHTIKNFDELGQRVARNIENEMMRAKFLVFHTRESAFARYEDGEEEQSFDYRLRMPSGKYLWLRTVVRLMREPKSMDILMFDYCYDINRKVIMEKMMKFAVNDDYDLLGSARFKQGTAYMMFGTDSYNETGSDYVEEDYTASLERFTKNAIVPWEREVYFKKACIQNIQKQLSQNDSYEFYLHMLKDDQIRVKKVRYVKSEEDPDLFMFTQMDVTLLVEEEKRKQGRLQTALEAGENANHSKTTFLSQMSHEIRTPMNAIIGMTQLAKDADSAKSKDEYLQKIDDSSHYLLGIINDILDMSRIESGRFELHPSWTPAKDILFSCINMLEAAMQKKEIRFIHPEVEYAGDVEYYVDSLRYQQVYMNLLNNAMKFTPEGGTVTLTIENLSHNEDSTVDRITVTDTGCGMSKDFLTRAFNPFEQEENPYSKSVQGTGLGLALVKEIVTAMGGTIEVKSILNEGSRFSFTLPCKFRYHKNDRNAFTKSNYEDVSLTGKRVLLVDDHPLNREIASKLLMKKGMLVEEAADGRQAVEMVKNAKNGYYDLVLMDIRMPELDGLEATRTIRALDKEGVTTLPIIAMTANAFDEDVNASFAAGMNGHLAKPIEPETMYQMIQKTLAKK